MAQEAENFTNSPGETYYASSEGRGGVLVSKDSSLVFQLESLSFTEITSQRTSVVLYVSNGTIRPIPCDRYYGNIPDFTYVTFVLVNGIATQVKPA